MRMKRRPWGEEVLKENKDKVMYLDELDKEEFKSYLDYPSLSLEIGAGKGDFIIDMAKKYPNTRFLAVEIQSMALSYAVRKIKDLDLNNVLFVNADISMMFEKLNGKKFDYIFLNHSDPWPKKRHHKRRLTYPTRLEEYSKILKEDGRLIFKSDNESLFLDSVEYIKESPFELESVDYNYNGEDEMDAQTEYEKKFRNLGTPIKRYVAKLKKEGK